jgi:hypothetical protein
MPASAAATPPSEGMRGLNEGTISLDGRLTHSPSFREPWSSK